MMKKLSFLFFYDFFIFNFTKQIELTYYTAPILINRREAGSWVRARGSPVTLFLCHLLRVTLKKNSLCRKPSRLPSSCVGGVCFSWSS